LSQEEARKLYKEGLAAFKANDKTQARQLLRKSVELDPLNENAWLWLAVVAKSLQETIIFLQRVLSINARNEHARTCLDWTLEKLKSNPSSWKCPLDPDSSLKQIEQCTRCNAILLFSDVDAILAPSGFDCPQIRRVAERYVQESAAADDFNLHTALALIYLNFKDFDRAVVHLNAIVRLHPDDIDLITQVDTIIKRLRQMMKDEGRPVIEPAKKGTVMVVDDSATVRKLVTLVLERESYKVLDASDGLEALTILNEEIPDFIFLDITMPRIDGYTLCKLIKSDEKTREIPVVMLSGKDGFFDKVRGRICGSSDHISKPFDPAMLVMAVEKYIHVGPNGRIFS
jgi:twitching motility two-component system response regulator PilG